MYLKFVLYVLESVPIFVIWWAVADRGLVRGSIIANFKIQEQRKCPSRLINRALAPSSALTR